MFFLFFPSFLPPTLFLSFPFYAFFLFHSSLSFFPAFSPFTLSLFCLPSFQPHFLSSSFPILFQCLILLILLSCPPFIYFLYLFFLNKDKKLFFVFSHSSFFLCLPRHFFLPHALSLHFLFLTSFSFLYLSSLCTLFILPSCPLPHSPYFSLSLFSLLFPLLLYSSFAFLCQSPLFSPSQRHLAQAGSDDED